MRYGLQMFGLNPIFLQDKKAFLERMRAAGYRYMEPCLALFDLPQISDRVWTEAQLDENSVLLAQYGMQINSCHVFTKDIEADLQTLIGISKKYEIKQFVLPCPQFDEKVLGERWARKLKRAADILQGENIELLLHNDKADSSARVDDMCAYEWILSQCGGSVGAQADVGWLLYGGVDPESFLWRNKDKVRSLHYKDMERCGGALREIGIGHGLVDMMACSQFARAVEIIQIADQDSSRGDFLEDMEFVAEKLRVLSQERDRTSSILCLLDTKTGEVSELHRFDKVIEAPNWMQTDDNCLIYNCDGRIFKYDISSDASTEIYSGHCTNCNNDHVLSPDNKRIAVSHSETSWMSQIYILAIEGGEPQLITPNAPSFLHGWSPDGEELAYCAFRDHGRGMEVDIYTIAADGGEEKRLTSDAGFNDGPEYSPDGKHIWFISTRSGLMQCWRMNRDGSEQTQMTFCERNNWFPHVSPDCSKVVYLSYSKEGLDPNEHLPNMQVELRIMNYDGSDDKTLLQFFGGQGSINVNSWSRDSRRVAFVKYELEHK